MTLTTYLAFDDVLQCIKPPQTGYVDVSPSGKFRFPHSSANARIHPKSSVIIITTTMLLSSHPSCCLSWSWQITDIIRMDVLTSELQSHFICHGLISIQDNQHLHLRVKKGRWGMGEGGWEGNRIRNEAMTYNVSLWWWRKWEWRIRKRFHIKDKLLIWPWVTFDSSSDISVQLYEDKLYFWLVPSEWWFSVVTERREHHWFLFSACSPAAAITSFTSCSTNRLTAKSDLPGTEMCNFREKSCRTACATHA